MADTKADIDENLYSRQIGVYGMETMGKLVKMRVLVVGMRGVGIETAKNLILAGPQSVTLYDPEPATTLDLGANFYLTPADIGKPRADAVVGKLKSLNPYVQVSVLAGTLSEASLDAFHVVVFTSTPQSQLLRYNEYCRAHSPPIGFVAANVVGLTGFAITDFGPTFTVSDPDGAPIQTAFVQGVEQDELGHVLLLGTSRHSFADGQWVRFKEVGGMTQLNELGPFQISRVTIDGFCIGDTRRFSAHTTGGIVEQVKVPFNISHQSLRARCASPTSLITVDPAFFSRSLELHAVYQGLAAYQDAHDGQLPGLRDQAAVDEVATYAESWAETFSETKASDFRIPRDVVASVVLCARVEFQPLAAVFGGVAAQEVVKFTGRYTPLEPWLYMDAGLVTPPEDLPESQFVLSGDRTDSMVALFGRDFVDKLSKLRLFLVGAGALGCEYLKAFAMLGIATADPGQVIVTDMDNIEVSNLNRQFLFRATDVHRPKSVVAAAAATTMNRALRTYAYESAVGAETEKLFNDDFWESLDVVVNALDNVQARRYVDGQCVFHLKPLIEAGTLGTMGNVQVVAPFKTCSYTDTVDPPEESIPVCTLKNFPFKIEHCIEWAREQFQTLFVTAVQDTASYLTDPSQFLTSLKSENSVVQGQRARAVLASLALASSGKLQDAVTAAVQWFHDWYYLEISQLLYNFPADHVTDKGQAFWTGTKRPPTPIRFNAADPLHMAFVVSGARILMAAHNIPVPDGTNADTWARAAAAVPLPEFAPKRVFIKADDNDKSTGPAPAAADEEVAAAALTALVSKAGTTKGVNVIVSPFEKDDDSNFHVDFVYTASNLRAINYKIEETTRQTVKMIAGKIIPAIATTTALVTGLASAELLKVVMGKPTDKLRDGFASLGVNLFVQCEPGPPVKMSQRDAAMGMAMRDIPEGFTAWDKIIVKRGPLTLDQFTRWVQDTYGVSISMLTMGSLMLYMPFMGQANRKHMTIEEAARTSLGHDLTEKYVLLGLSGEDEDGNDVSMPPFQVYLQ